MCSDLTEFRIAAREPDPSEPPSDLSRLRPVTPASDSAPDLRAPPDHQSTPPPPPVDRLSSQRLSETVTRQYLPLRSRRPPLCLALLPAVRFCACRYHCKVEAIPEDLGD